MATITYLINNYNIELIIGTYILIGLMVLLLIIQMIKTSKLKKRYNNMFKGEDIKNIEEMLLSQKKKIESIINTHDNINTNLLELEKALKLCYSKSTIFRYDAFSGLAGRLSFVYVLLNETNSGVILNGIYSSEGHYLYIKEVVAGKTEKELSKEERSTLEQTMAK